MKHQKSKSSRGFSLIELAIFFLVSGILFSMSINAYDQYRTKKKMIETQNKVEQIAKAFSLYFSQYGRYPCPARSDVDTTNAAFGSSIAPIDCHLATLPSGIASTTRAIDHDNNPLTANINVRILEGSIPFVELRDGIDDPAMGFTQYTSPFPINANDTIDAYGSRFTYAITDRQGANVFLEGGGGIIIQDEWGKVLSDDADYIIISHGQDRSGAIAIDTTPSPVTCTGGNLDIENCDGDGVFIDSIRYDSGGLFFDDQMIYRDWLAFFLWDVQEAAPEHIYNMNAGNVGIGITWPKQKMHVSGGSVRAESNLMSQEICDHAVDENENSPGTACFSSDYVAGITMPICGPGEVAVGVANRQPICVPLYSVTGNTSCPSGQFIEGFSYDPGTRTLSLVCSP